MFNIENFKSGRSPVRCVKGMKIFHSNVMKEDEALEKHICSHFIDLDYKMYRDMGELYMILTKSDIIFLKEYQTEI